MLRVSGLDVHCIILHRDAGGAINSGIYWARASSIGLRAFSGAPIDVGVVLVQKTEHVIK